MAFFKVIETDKKTKARAGILQTPHGEIQTPVFVPVGTQGTVKSLTPEDLSKIGVQIFLANTYHLYLRPGAEVIEKLGGLHKFAGWNKPLMTDSGGFQVFSLAGLINGDGSCRSSAPSVSHTPNKAGALQGEPSGRAPAWGVPTRVTRRLVVAPSLVKIDDNGVTFRSHLDGSSHRFTPEISIEIQKKLGADIILTFDECPPYGVEKEMVRKATERTHQWALRSLAAAQGKPKSHQALFGIVQGGVFKDLREESAKFISSLALPSSRAQAEGSGIEGFDGIAIGGVAVGESKEEMVKVLDWIMPYLPDEKPRHLLGVGEIDDVFEAVERGIDMFDCVMPTRLGRMGHALAQVSARGGPAFGGKSPKLKVKSQKWRVDITKTIFKNDPRPIMEDCQCYTCQNFSRAYLNHLFRSRELLAYRLATYHNLWFMENLMRQIREAIVKGQFRELKKGWLGH